MRIVRYFLLAASAAGAAFPLYTLLFQEGHTRLDRLIALSYAVGLSVNFIYVLYCERPKS